MQRQHAGAAVAVLLAVVFGCFIQESHAAVVAKKGQQPDPNKPGHIMACPAGTFKKSAGNVPCTSCAGMRSSGFPSTALYQQYTGKTSCWDCGPAGTVNTAGTACTPGPGYELVPGHQPRPCRPGYAKPTTSTDKCMLCSGRTYQPSSGQASCLTCVAGGNVNAKRTHCSKCPVNAIAPLAPCDSTCPDSQCLTGPTGSVYGCDFETLSAPNGRSGYYCEVKAPVFGG